MSSLILKGFLILSKLITETNLNADPLPNHDICQVDRKKVELKRLFQDYYIRLYITGKIDGIEEIEDRWKKIKKEGLYFKYIFVRL